MVKKIIISLTFFSLTFLSSVAQQPQYFPNRLIIKYESDALLNHIRAKTNSAPLLNVRRVLSKEGGNRIRPLVKESLFQSKGWKSLATAREIRRIHEVIFDQEINAPLLASKVSKLPGVAYAEPKYVRKMYYTPNDPQLESFITAHRFDEAWNLSQGSKDIVVAIDDGGVGYIHSELDDNLWVNQDEVPPTLEPQVDQNSDETITSTEIKNYLQNDGEDYNGDGTINLADALAPDSPFMDQDDNDNNNFKDDLFGWDFWASGSGGAPITQDNNPLHDGTDHGTHVAGIAAAETDNGEGIAGAAFNTTYMPVKTGGIPDDPSTPGNDESNLIGFGYEGIIYAAQNGADIINCSWGGSGSSQAEQEIINLATEMGALIIAASGNEGTDQVGYPAAYDNVLAVGSVEPSNVVANYSNYGYKLDVLAAGTDILSTSFNQSLVTKTGTSMATPVVSGLASLIKSVHPTWSPERIRHQIRSSASFIDNTNSQRYQHKLGHGAIDAFRALNTDFPGIELLSQQFVDGNGEKLTPGEDGTIRLTITNQGSATSSLELQIDPLTENGITLANQTKQLGSLATGDTVDISFPISISEQFDLAQSPTFRANIYDAPSNYEDFTILQYKNLLYDIVAANNIKTSLAADGTIGFSKPLSQSGGIGFIPRTPDGNGGYQEGENLLFEGGLILEINGNIFDATRTEGGVSRDFVPKQVFIPEITNNGITGKATFTVDNDSSIKADILLEAFAFNEPSLRNLLYLKYTVKNPSSYAVMNNVYLGLFNDWDIGDSGNNSIAYSEQDSILYLFEDSPSSTQPLVSVAHLGPVSGTLAIDNTLEGQQDSLTFGLYDGFTDEEKSVSLTSGISRTQVSNTDASAVTASGPYTINPKASITIGFLYAFGDDLNQLRDFISEGRSQKPFVVSPSGIAVADDIPTKVDLFQNYPNPFNNATTIHFNLPQKENVTLNLYDILGRKVQTVRNKQYRAGEHFIPFSADGLSSGVYFLRLELDNTIQTIPITLIK